MQFIKSIFFVIVSLYLNSSVQSARQAKSLLAKSDPGDEDTFDKEDDRADAQSAEHRVPSQDGVGTMSRAVCARRSSGRRVVSVADQHGDFEGLVDHLQRLGLVRNNICRSPGTWNGSWVGGDAIFVQTGDILDRGPDGKLMYKFLWALQDDAPRAGGEVVLLPGNHELMVLQSDVRYVTDIDFCTYTNDTTCKGVGNYPSSPCNVRNKYCSRDPSRCMRGNCEFLESWDKHGEMGGEMRQRFRDGKMKLVYEVNGVLFTHAGLVSSIWDKVGARAGRRPIDTLNSAAVELFTSNSTYDLWYSRDVIATTGGQGGPLWTRVCYSDWYTRSGRRRRNGDNKPYYMDVDEFERVESGRCPTVAASLRVANAARMVIGHCPQRDGDVKISCSGSFIQADTYMSVAYTGSRSRSIRNYAAIEFYSQDSSQRAWIVYVGRNECEELPRV